MPRLIDLRSDTVTKPTELMRKAMYEAEVGDDVFGDDPTVNRLQAKVAELLGKEAALYVPSGTMANQIAILCHTSPGDEIYCEAGCHTLNYEAGAPAFLAGVVMCPIQGARGVFTVEDVMPRLKPTDSHFPQSRLIWVENSHNRSGGTIFPLSECRRLSKFAGDHGLGIHLDGARLWNVAAATGMEEWKLAAPFQSVSVCMSKGLGAPVGSLVAGSKEFIKQAHRFRKRLGGGMRQAGVIAAAGIYALDNHRARLTDDHDRARRLAAAVAEIPAFSIDLESVQTNMVIFDVAPGGRTGAEVAAALKDDSILATHFGSKVRMVTHLDVDDAAIDKATQILRKRFA